MCISFDFLMLTTSYANLFSACSLDLSLRSGLVIGVPVPEQHSADGQMIEAAIQEALAEAA